MMPVEKLCPVGRNQPWQTHKRTCLVLSAGAYLYGHALRSPVRHVHVRQFFGTAQQDTEQTGEL